MLFTETTIPGVWLLQPEKIADERGFFCRTWCQQELADRGLDTSLLQCNVSFNHRRGTLRGLHWQADPHGEVKLVRCTRGAIWDVAVDLRPESPTYLKWTAHELSADNHHQLYLPEGIAHGFQTLTDDAEVFYQMSQTYHREAARSARWNDPTFGITWPLPVSVIADRDAHAADYPALVASVQP